MTPLDPGPWNLGAGQDHQADYVRQWNGGAAGRRLDGSKVQGPGRQWNGGAAGRRLESLAAAATPPVKVHSLDPGPWTLESLAAAATPPVKVHMPWKGSERSIDGMEGPPDWRQQQLPWPPLTVLAFLLTVLAFLVLASLVLVRAAAMAAAARKRSLSLVRALGATWDARCSLSVDVCAPSADT